MNVFLVTSPFQYICANEARIEYKTKENILILIEQNSPAGIQQMNSILEEKNWDYVLRFPRNKRTTVTPKIIESVKHISKGSLEILFYSEYNAWRTKLIMRNLDFKQHVFFDDGTMTFADYYDHMKPNKPYRRKRFIQDVLLRCQGMMPIGEMSIFHNTEIFSIFLIPDCVVNYKENKLQSLQKLVKKNTRTLKSINVFIGQGCIGEKGHVNLSEYLKQIRQALSYNSSLLYIPHRTEAKQVSEAVRSLTGLKYHSASHPIELELVKCGFQPDNIFGVTSTALYTLSKIYPKAKIQLIERSQHITVSSGESRVQRYLCDYFSNKL